MHNIDPTIRFQYNGGVEQLDKECEKVTFGLEYIGENPVLELLDYELLENFLGVRQVIRTKFQTFFAESNWFKDFLQATDKEIVIDNTTYAVVVDGRIVEFEHFKKTNYISNVELTFKKKVQE